MSAELKKLLIVAFFVGVVSVGFYFFMSRGKQETASNLSVASAGEASSSFTYGPKDAKVTVVEFFDPECESCAKVSPYIKGEMKYYEGKVRWVFRYMAYHPNSRNAIRLLEAARKQNLYLEALALFFDRQAEWGARHDGTDQSGSKESVLISILASLPNIKMAQVDLDLKDPQFTSYVDKIIEADKREGTEAGVTGTPTLFVNGKMINPLSLDTMIAWINEALK